MFNSKKNALEFLSEVTLRLIDTNSTQAEALRDELEWWNDAAAEVEDDELAGTPPTSLDDIDVFEMPSAQPETYVLHYSSPLAVNYEPARRMRGEWVVYTQDSTPLHVVGEWAERDYNDPQYSSVTSKPPVQYDESGYGACVIHVTTEDRRLQRIVIPAERVTYIDESIEEVADPEPPPPPPERWTEVAHT